jgi:hypothetical protein
LWKLIFNWWNHATKIVMPITSNEIIFGLPNPNKDVVINHYNYVILQAKYYIYKCKQGNKELCMYQFLLSLKNALLLKLEACDSNELKKVETNWSDLLEIL